MTAKKTPPAFPALDIFLAEVSASKAPAIPYGPLQLGDSPVGQASSRLLQLGAFLHQKRIERLQVEAALNYAFDEKQRAELSGRFRKIDNEIHLGKALFALDLYAACEAWDGPKLALRQGGIVVTSEAERDQYDRITASAGRDSERDAVNFMFGDEGEKLPTFDEFIEGLVGPGGLEVLRRAATGGNGHDSEHPPAAHH